MKQLKINTIEQVAQHGHSIQFEMAQDLKNLEGWQLALGVQRLKDSMSIDQVNTLWALFNEWDVAFEELAA